MQRNIYVKALARAYDYYFEGDLSTEQWERAIPPVYPAITALRPLIVDV